MAWNLEEAAAYYRSQGAPGDQSALVAFLQEIQQEYGGGIPTAVVREAADACGVKESFLLAVIKRFPSLRLQDTHCLELCAGPNCGKHRALAACAEQLLARHGFVLKFVPCMRQCGKGPNLRWDGVTYHQATEVLLRQLTEQSERNAQN